MLQVLAGKQVPTNTEECVVNYVSEESCGVPEQCAEITHTTSMCLHYELLRALQSPLRAACNTLEHRPFAFPVASKDECDLKHPDATWMPKSSRGSSTEREGGGRCAL